MDDVLEKVFGTDFVKKKLELEKRSNVPVLELTPEKKEKVIQKVLEYMKPDTNFLIFEDEGVQYYIVLVTTNEEIRPYDLKFGTSLGVYYNGQKYGLSMLIPDFKSYLFDLILPATNYILVGKLYTNKKGTKTYTNFRVDDLITLDEIHHYKMLVESEDKENDLEKLRDKWKDDYKERQTTEKNKQPRAVKKAE